MVNGDLSRLSPEQRVVHYKKTCESVGLNPFTKPFDYITLSGRLVLYAKRDATDQLRKLYNVSIKIKERSEDEEFHSVFVTGSTADGRHDEACGIVVIKGLKGLDLANARMKAETKAKRRLTLSICGLGVLDETEIEDIPKEQKGSGAPLIRPEPPGPDDGVLNEGIGPTYMLTVGQWNGRRLSQVERENGLDKMAAWCEKNRGLVASQLEAGKFTQEKYDRWMKDIAAIEGYIGERELEMAEEIRNAEPGSAG